MFTGNETIDAATDELVEELLNTVMEDKFTRGIGTGVRAAILCLYNAGLLAGEALAYGAVLGHPELDPLIVANLGIYRGGEEQFQADVNAAFDAHGDACQRAADDLGAAADHLRAQYDTPDEEDSDDGAGEAPDATEG